MPPAPSGAMISYRPMEVAGGSDTGRNHLMEERRVRHRRGYGYENQSMSARVRTNVKPSRQQLARGLWAWRNRVRVPSSSTGQPPTLDAAGRTIRTGSRAWRAVRGSPVRTFRLLHE